MAKNGAKGGGRYGVVSSRIQVKGPTGEYWSKPDRVAGQFSETKKAGGPSKGVRRER